MTLVQNKSSVSFGDGAAGQGGNVAVVSKKDSKKKDDRTFASKALIVVLYILSIGLFLASALAWRRVVPFLAPYSQMGKDALPFASLFMFAMTITMTVTGFATAAIIGYILSAMSALYYFFPFDRANRAVTHVGSPIDAAKEIEEEMVAASQNTNTQENSGLFRQTRHTDVHDFRTQK